MKIPLLAFVSWASYAIPTIAGIWRFKRLDRPMKIFLLFCIWSSIEVSVEYVLSSNRINNHLLINYGYLIDTLFLSILYSSSTDDKKTKKIFLFLTLIFGCLWIVDALFFAFAAKLNSEMAMTSRILIIIMSILILFDVVRKTDRLLVDESIFWISTGFALYSAGVFLIFGLSNELVKLGPIYFLIAWHINWALVIVTNLMFTKGFFCKAKQYT